METRLRSIIKALSWRTGGLIVTTVVAWKVIGDLKFGVMIGLLDTVVKIFAYYAHERIWNRVRYGQLKRPEYEI